MPDTSVTTTDQSTDPDDRPLTPDERLALATVYGLLTGMGAQR